MLVRFGLLVAVDDLAEMFPRPVFGSRADRVERCGRIRAEPGIGGLTAGLIALGGTLLAATALALAPAGRAPSDLG